MVTVGDVLMETTMDNFALRSTANKVAVVVTTHQHALVGEGNFSFHQVQRKKKLELHQVIQIPE